MRLIASILIAGAAAALAGCSSKTYMPYGGDAGAMYTDRDFRAYDAGLVLSRYQQVFREAGYTETGWSMGSEDDGRTAHMRVTKAFEVVDGEWVKHGESVGVDERGRKTINIDRRFTTTGFTLRPEVKGTILLSLTDSNRVKSVSYEIHTDPQRAISLPKVGVSGHHQTPAHEFRDLVWAVLGPMTNRIAPTESTGSSPKKDS